MKFRILIVDDEKSIRDIFTLVLEEKGYAVRSAENGAAGTAAAAAFRPDVLLLDMNLPDMSGLDVLADVRARLPGCRIIIITAYGTIKNAVEATKLGAYAYLEKPVDNEELLLLVERALEVKQLEAEVEELRTELTSRYAFENIVGTSARMNSVFQLMHKMAPVEGTVLVTGESGTGKELVARAIHFAGPRKAAVRGRELRGDPEGPHRVRVLRTCQRGLYGRQIGDDGKVRDGPRRDDLPRRDRRALGRRSGQAPPGSGRAGDRQGRRDEDDLGRRPGHRRNEQASWTRRSPRDGSAKTSSSGWPSCRFSFPLCGRGRRTFRCWASIFWRNTPGN